MSTDLTPGESSPPQRAWVLLVDESESSRVELVELLQRFCEVSAVVSAVAGLAMLERGSLPDLVLCDRHNGLVLLKRIRGNELWAHLRVVVMCGREDLQDRAVRLEELADDYVERPCAPQVLLARVQSQLRSAQCMREVVGQLRESEAILQSLIVSATDCLMMLDLHGRLVWMSEGGQACLELRDFVEWRYRNWVEIWLEPATRQEARDALQGALQRKIGRFRGHCPTARGKSRWWEVTVTPILDEMGQTGSLLCVMHDVTAVNRADYRLRASERRWREFTHAVPHLLWTGGPDGSADFLNAQWEAYSGVPAEHNLGMGWRMLVHPDDVDVLVTKWREVSQTGGRLHAEVRLLNREGQYRWFKVDALPERNEQGEIVKWFGSNTDIEELKRAERTLREKEARLSAVFEQAGAGIVQMNAQGKYLMVNDAYCEITGRSREWLLRSGIVDTTHPDDLELSLPPFKALFEGGPPFVIEKRYVQPDGTVVWARKSLVGLCEGDGKPVGAALAIVHDITESREAEEELLDREAQLRLVTNHAPVLLAHMDCALRYKFVNEHYAGRYGLAPDDMIGRLAAEVVGVETVQAAQPYIERVLRGEQVEFEMLLPYHSLGERWVHVVYVPEFVGENAIGGFLVVLTDITQRKQSELELQQTRDEALAASRAKDDFLARLSHELRTPLNPALLLASEAASNMELPEAIRAEFETIRKHVDLEARLIDDLLDLTRITRDKLTLEKKPVLIQTVLEDAVRTVMADAQQKRLRLDLQLRHPQVVVNGDAVRLQQVIWNVLKNAIKFSLEGEVISVMTHLEDKLLRIEVRDSGIGMEPEELEKVFQAFAQGQHAEKTAYHRFGGLGLGLTISRMLAELHDGMIRAESLGRGKGSTFFIELPVKAVDGKVAVPKTTQVQVGDTPGHLRILLVEDHAPTRDAMAALLRRRQHSVVVAGGVKEAIEAAHGHIFDLLISDIGLPDGTGYDLMVALRQLCGLPGIALTGYGMEQDVARSREVGFTTHLTKPVRVQMLEEAIASCMSAERVQRSGAA